MNAVMTNDEYAIRQTVDSWLSATKAGDAATVLALMTDDAVFMLPGQEPFGKDAFAKAFDNLKSVRIDGTSEIVELQVFGDWAYARTYVDISITPPDGEAVRRSGYTLTIFRKENDGKWQLARDANLLTAHQ